MVIPRPVLRVTTRTSLPSNQRALVGVEGVGAEVVRGAVAGSGRENERVRSDLSEIQRGTASYVGGVNLCST